MLRKSIAPFDKSYAAISMTGISTTGISIIDLLLACGLLLSTAFLGCSVVGIRNGYEQVQYDVVDNVKDVEIRHYQKRVVAEFNGAKTNRGAFLALFNYISGENRVKTKVSMTSPVEVADANAKIAMTAPVELSNSDSNLDQDATNKDTIRMRFFLPTSFTIDTAPRPTNEKISIKELPAENYAVLRYSGINSKEVFKNKSDQLQEMLKNSKWEIVGQPKFMGYDPPFTIPPLRRNEAIVKVIAK